MYGKCLPILITVLLLYVKLIKKKDLEDVF